MESKTKVTLKELDRFTACFAFVFNADYNSLRGITDPIHKMVCIYAARKIFDVSNGVISTYYRVNVEYMLTQMEEVALSELLYENVAQKLKNLRLYWELEVGKK